MKLQLCSPSHNHAYVNYSVKYEAIEQEILDRIEKNPISGCWLWTGHIQSGPKGGYAKYASRLIHRLMYEALIGPIPEGLQIDHLCRNRACVNPDHLEPVTSRENTLRGNGLSATNARKTHCKHGHEFTPENTRMKLSRHHGERICRTCDRRLKAEARQRASRRIAS